MNQPIWGKPRFSKVRVTLVGALLAGVAGTVSLSSSMSSAQAVEGGDAACDALDVALFAEVGAPGSAFLDISGGTDDVVAPDPENGTNNGSAPGRIAVEGIGGAVAIDWLTCEATRAPDSLSAESQIVGGDLTGIAGELVTLDAVSSNVACPAAGTADATASASASLTIDGEAVELDSDGGMLVDEVNVDFSIPNTAEGIINVAAGTSATVDDNSAAATGLQLTLTFSGAIGGQSVLLDLGTVTLAETSCTMGELDDGAPPPTVSSTTPPPITAPPPPAPPATAPPATAPVFMLPVTR
ncbi:MAG: hypothetical protein WKF45_06020 [Ilumatobacteraceae bacterium]